MTRSANRCRKRSTSATNIATVTTATITSTTTTAATNTNTTTTITTTTAVIDAFMDDETAADLAAQAEADASVAVWVAQRYAVWWLLNFCLNWLLMLTCFIALQIWPLEPDQLRAWLLPLPLIGGWAAASMDSARAHLPAAANDLLLAYVLAKVLSPLRYAIAACCTPCVYRTRRGKRIAALVARWGGRLRRWLTQNRMARGIARRVKKVRRAICCCERCRGRSGRGSGSENDSRRNSQLRYSNSSSGRRHSSEDTQPLVSPSTSIAHSPDIELANRNGKH